MDTRTSPRTYAPGDEPLDRRIVSRDPDLELWQGAACHACWTRDEVVGYPSFWPSVNRWLETGMREDLRPLIDGSWATRGPKDPVRVDLPPPRVQGFGEVFRRIGERLDGKDDAKLARIDPTPIIAPGTICLSDGRAVCVTKTCRNCARAPQNKGGCPQTLPTHDCNFWPIEAVCDRCGQRYKMVFIDVAIQGLAARGEVLVPRTQKPWTCDDCGGSVGVE